MALNNNHSFIHGDSPQFVELSEKLNTLYLDFSFNIDKSILQLTSKHYSQKRMIDKFSHYFLLVYNKNVAVMLQ